MKTVIGILGGLGPETTAAFYLRVVQLATRTVRPAVCIWSLPLNLRKEHEYIARGDHREYYVRRLTEGANALRSAQSSFLAIPCNTVHEFYHQVSTAAQVPVVNMIDCTAQEVSRRKWRKALLLATSRTIRTRLYHRHLKVRGVEIVTPDGDQQGKLDLLIRGILGNSASGAHQQFLETLIEESGTEHVVLGCTDLQLLVAPSHNVIDSMTTLASCTARMAWA